MPPASPNHADALRRAAGIRCVALDVDGTLTDGGIHIGAHGELFKRFSVRDGFGLRLLREAGLRVAIITGRRSEIVTQRAAELGIDDVHQGSHDKCADLLAVCARHGLQPGQVACMGDDWPDLAVMALCGLAAAPADAEPCVRAQAHWVSQRPGGHGAVRELCEFVLEAQHALAALKARYGVAGPPAAPDAAR